MFTDFIATKILTNLGTLVGGGDKVIQNLL
jgi:hypothetical protein